MPPPTAPSPAASKPHSQPCAHCGLPVYGPQTSEAVFCCHGCEIVHRLADDAATPDVERPSPLATYFLRWIIATVLAMFLVLLSVTIHHEGNTAPYFLRWLSLFLATGVFLLLGQEFVQALLQEISRRQLSIASLVFVGSSSAYLLSTWHVVIGDDGLYFETAAMILSLFVGSLILDAYLKSRLARISQLWTVEDEAEVDCLRDDGTIWRTPVDDLRIGDIFIPEKDAPIRVDADVVSGSGQIDTAHLTGEPDPIVRQTGDSISAGSQYLEGDLRLRVTAPADASSLQHYLQRLTNLRAKPGEYEKLASRGASYLLGFVMTVAVLTFGFYIWQGSLHAAWVNSLSVLLIGCPCAMSIATPAAMWIANHRLHRAGVVVTGGGLAIEKLATVRKVLFDKTGTLTDGMAVDTILAGADYRGRDVNHLISILAGLQAEQRHPIARAIRSYAQRYQLAVVPVSGVSTLPGLGVQGVLKQGDVAHDLLFVNRHHPLAANLSENVHGLFMDGQHMLTMTFTQAPRGNIQGAIRRLKTEMGINSAVLTGDPNPAAAAFESIPYHAGCTPDDKARLVDDYNATNGHILFVGDGINDLLAMARAEVTVAIASGANLAKSEADFVVFHPDLAILPEMISFARQVRGRIILNLLWAVIYNFFGIGLAAFGFLNPLLAITFMILSSTFVTLNSLRLFNQNPYLTQLSERKDQPSLTPHPAKNQTHAYVGV